MANMLLNGAPIKQKIKDELREVIQTAIKNGNAVPHLAIVMVGNNPRSQVYINQKIAFAHAIGVQVTTHTFSEESSTADLCREVSKIGSEPTVHGIIIQMPLPGQFSLEDSRKIIDMVPVTKDADGLTTLNMGRLTTGDKDAVVPATSRGILELCNFYNIEIEGKNVVLIGRSNLVGKPTALSLLERGATVTICHSHTSDLPEMVKMADIVISATGRSKLIGKDMVRGGQFIIDVGITIDNTGKISGDIDTLEVEPIVAGVSPVPGGVGPLTVSGLFLNLIDLYRSQQ